jgi:tetratricopeptide (TPR) repeat protein
VSALNNKSEALNNLGRSTEAIELINHALKIEPDNPYAYYNLGIAFNSLEKYKDAKNCFKAARESKFTRMRQPSLTPLFHA